jgi:hypothetical protein
MLTAVNQCHPLEHLFAHIMFVEYDICSPLLFPHTPVSRRSYSEDLRRYGGVPRRLTEMLGVRYPQSEVSMKNEA